MKTLVEPTYQIRIYISGPIEVIKQTCRTECLRQGLCVTVDPTTYIYTGGEEAGAVIGLINYPRFPTTPAELDARARTLALKLLDDTKQHSVLIITPSDTQWVTLRND